MSKIKQSPITAAGEVIIRNIFAQGAMYGATTDEAISKKLGVPRSTVTYWRNNPSVIGVKGLVLASQAFKCSLAWLVTDHRGEYNDK